MPYHRNGVGPITKRQIQWMLPILLLLTLIPMVPLFLVGYWLFLRFW